MKVSFSQVMAWVMSWLTKPVTRSMMGVKVARARCHTSLGLKMSVQLSESVKRVKASRMVWKFRPRAAVCAPTQSATRVTMPWRCNTWNISSPPGIRPMKARRMLTTLRSTTRMLMGLRPMMSVKRV